MRSIRHVSLIVPVAALLALAGCASGDAEPTATATVTESASPSSGAPVASGTPSPIESSTDAHAPEGQCDTADITAAVEGGEGAAGSIESSIVFTNTGDAECALSGWPGVFVVGDGNGTQLGAAAEQTGAGADVVTLAPGGTAIADLSSVNVGTNGGPLGDQCPVVEGDGYRVYPPHSYDTVFVEAPGTPACDSDASFLSVGAVHDP